MTGYQRTGNIISVAILGSHGWYPADASNAIRWATILDCHRTRQEPASHRSWSRTIQRSRYLPEPARLQHREIP